MHDQSEPQRSMREVADLLNTTPRIIMGLIANQLISGPTGGQAGRRRLYTQSDLREIRVALALLKRKCFKPYIAKLLLDETRLSELAPRPDGWNEEQAEQWPFLFHQSTHAQPNLSNAEREEFDELLELHEFLIKRLADDEEPTQFLKRVRVMIRASEEETRLFEPLLKRATTRMEGGPESVEEDNKPTEQPTDASVLEETSEDIAAAQGHRRRSRRNREEQI